MALDVLSVGPLYQGPDVNRIRGTAEPSRPPAFLRKSSVPSKTKLTTIETKRIMSVLDETIYKVELATLLSDVASRNKDLEGMLGEDVTTAVREHEDLCRAFLDRVSRLQEAERQVQEEEELEEETWFRDHLLSVQLQKSHFRPLRQQIRESTRNILRLLLGNPQAAKLLQRQRLGRSAEAQTFIDSLMELRGFLFERLLTSPMEAREKAQFIRDITKRNKRNQEVIDALENELAESRKTRDAEVEKENFVIRELKNHLHQVLRFSENSLLRTRQESEKRQKADHRASRARAATLQQEALRLRSQFQSLLTENWEAEQALRKKKYKVETEIENWIQKYDTEMGEKQDEFEELDFIHKEEKAQLEELKQRYNVLEEEFAQIREEREVIFKKKMEAEQELARMTRAATLIQAVWKGYLVRSMLKSRRKRGKGKGKGKGKVKGKGKGKK